MYSLQPRTSSSLPSGSSIILTCRLGVVGLERRGDRPASDPARARASTSAVMNASRAGVTGVSLPTDHRMTDARFLSRRIDLAELPPRVLERGRVLPVDRPVDRDFGPDEHARRSASRAMFRCGGSAPGARSCRSAPSPSRAACAHPRLAVAARPLRSGASSCMQIPRRKTGWPFSRISRAARPRRCGSRSRRGRVSPPGLDDTSYSFGSLGRPELEPAPWKRNAARPLASVWTVW